jgi:hypothetical protein
MSAEGRGLVGGAGVPDATTRREQGYGRLRLLTFAAVIGAAAATAWLAATVAAARPGHARVHPVSSAASGGELWYLTRASGVVALVLLTGVVALGVATTGTWERRSWPRFVTQGLHRNLSMLSVWFLAIHVGTSVVDGHLPIGWAGAVAPFTSPYRRLWLGFGAIAGDLLLAVILTSVVRRRLRPGTWRGIHWLAYASWPIALLHGLGAGTDATADAVRALTAGCLLLVAGAVAWRLSHRFPAGTTIRVAGGLALLLTLAGAAFGLDGGLRPHVSFRVVTAAPESPGTPSGTDDTSGSISGSSEPAPEGGNQPGAPGSGGTASGPDAGPALTALAIPAVERTPASAGGASVDNGQPTAAVPAPGAGPAPSPTATTTPPSSSPPPPPSTTPPSTTPPSTTTTTTAPPTTTTTTTPRHCTFSCNGRGNGLSK